ncbi:MAG: sigma-54-dependent Fis family transcriptional regulator, partial [Myxococcales bacterium]|nr:sigma-54-dependent Fis family transcriptional regulator [Myxococcales bacterium]
GKELVAQAIHAASKRGRRPMVARNAATIPAGIVDAELFGNVANYPNPGTPERRGLVGESDGSTLFLDEIGELAEDLQVRLLRVLDERGEYQRLGEARPRSSDLRLIGATNRPLAALKHDVAARFRLRLRVPGLEERREDVPLIARQLLQRIATNDADIRRRFFEDDDAARPRVSASLMRALVRHRYRTHCRELDAILWHSIATSPEDVLDLTAEVEEDLALAAPAAGSHRRPGEVTADEVRAALERAGGVQEKAWRDLGLANRYVLKRLIAKLGL